MNTHDGKRTWASKYKFEKNATTWTETIAEKLIFEGKRVVSVQGFRTSAGRSQERVSVTVRKEILLTSGVQGSAKLLLLRQVLPTTYLPSGTDDWFSGIGPVKELRKQNSSSM